ncbi:MAG TPA: TlpA disulfide reductase family protein [Burkholderiaceae bacterium]|nr:TlpA disulfide reductase family protein [Burkholderiaceae bacterium]
MHRLPFPLLPSSPSNIRLARRRLITLLALGPCLALPAAASHEAVAWPDAVPAPPFSLVDSKGGTWTLAGQRGKVVLLNFWASWCEPCRAEMPSLQQLADLYGSELVVLAVNFKEREARVNQFAQNAGLALPLLMDRDGAVAAQYGIKIFPSTVLIARDGKAKMRITGEVDWTGREASRWLEPLLLQRPR